MTAGAAEWAATCSACDAAYPVEEFRWRCECDGLLDLAGPPLDPATMTALPALPWSLWRYAGALPPLAVAGSPAVSMGEGMTPLVPGPGGVWLKGEFVSPTLSFKDRGAAVMVAGMSAAGVRSVVADSSGNAGAALAAYAARAGIGAEIFVPASTSPGKQAAIAGTGASVRLVEGPRAAATVEARRRVADTGAVYASHVHQPLFVQGTKTCAYELWEQLGRRAPGTVVAACGNGSMVLGLHLGFGELLAADLVDHMPRIVAVQAERCAPLAGRDPRPGDRPTVAEGIAIAAPPRAGKIMDVLARTGGRVLLADEDRIGPAQADLGAHGVDVEPTAAAVWAAWSAAPPATTIGPGPTVVILGGAGAKARRTP